MHQNLRLGCVCRRPGEDREPAAVSVQPDVEDRQMSAGSGERGADAGGQSRGEGETGQDRNILQAGYLSSPANL